MARKSRRKAGRIERRGGLDESERLSPNGLGHSLEDDIRPELGDDDLDLADAPDPFETTIGGIPVSVDDIQRQLLDPSTTKRQRKVLQRLLKVAIRRERALAREEQRRLKVQSKLDAKVAKADARRGKIESLEDKLGNKREKISELKEELELSSGLDLFDPATLEALGLDDDETASPFAGGSFPTVPVLIGAGVLGVLVVGIAVLRKRKPKPKTPKPDVGAKT